MLPDTQTLLPDTCYADNGAVMPKVPDLTQIWALYVYWNAPCPLNDLWTTWRYSNNHIQCSLIHRLYSQASITRTMAHLCLNYQIWPRSDYSAHIETHPVLWMVFEPPGGVLTIIWNVFWYTDYAPKCPLRAQRRIYAQNPRSDPDLTVVRVLRCPPASEWSLNHLGVF